MKLGGFSVEPARSGRSKCRECGKIIEKGTLRMGVYAAGCDDLYSQWFHLVGCFAKITWHGLNDTNDILGFSQLVPAQQSTVIKHVFGGGIEEVPSVDDDIDISIKELSLQFGRTQNVLIFQFVKTTGDLLTH